MQLYESSFYSLRPAPEGNWLPEIIGEGNRERGRRSCERFFNKDALADETESSIRGYEVGDSTVKGGGGRRHSGKLVFSSTFANYLASMREITLVISDIILR